MVILLSQAERFFTQGTLFGYQVRSVKTKQQIAQQNKSGALLNAEKSAENQKSIACDKFPAAKVKQAMGSEVERISGFVADRTEPTVTSTCIYRTKNGDRNSQSVLILYRELKDETAAKKTLDALKQPKDGEDITGLGDAAYFNTHANQLSVQKGKELFTITIPNASKDKKSKDVAIGTAKIAL
ncbi:MAG: hypothetical protein U0520_02160 [Candidatus Saccharimonadales bacterium]